MIIQFLINMLYTTIQHGNFDTYFQMWKLVFYRSDQQNMVGLMVIRKIFALPVFVILITIFAFLPPDTHAITTIDLKDQASCQAAPLSGTWVVVNSTCRINSLTLNLADSLTLDNSINSRIALTITGTLSNSGTILNSGIIHNSGTISGSGKFTSALLTITNTGT